MAVVLAYRNSDSVLGQPERPGRGGDDCESRLEAMQLVRVCRGTIERGRNPSSLPWCMVGQGYLCADTGASWCHTHVHTESHKYTHTHTHAHKPMHKRRRLDGIVIPG